MKAKTIQEIADFFDAPIGVYNGNVMFTEYMDVNIPLEMVSDYVDKDTEYTAIPYKDKPSVPNEKIITFDMIKKEVLDWFRKTDNHQDNYQCYNGNWYVPICGCDTLQDILDSLECLISDDENDI